MVLLFAADLNAQTVYTWWSGFEGCSNGVAPTTTTLGNGTHTTQTVNWSIGAIAPGLLCANAAQLSNYPSQISVNSILYNGSGSLGIQGTTSTTGTNVGFISAQWVTPTPSAAAALYVEWSCPSTGNIDCGALGGLFTYPSGKYAVFHVKNSSGVQGIYLESSGQIGQTSPITVSPNTVYLINLQQNGGTGNSDYMTVCNATGTTVLGSVSQPNGISDTNQPSFYYTGITGEEPTTSGYTYEWDNIAVDTTGAAFSATGCFPPNGSRATQPSCSPTSGIVPQTVTCTNPNSGTTVLCYGFNQTIPVTNGLGTACTTGTIYTTPLSIPQRKTLNVVAGTSILSDSFYVSYYYSPVPADPRSMMLSEVRHETDVAP